MKEVVAVVERGQIVLPPETHLPEGRAVRIVWDEDELPPPLEREPLTEDEVRADLEWANGRRFAS